MQSEIATWGNSDRGAIDGVVDGGLGGQLSAGVSCLRGDGAMASKRRTKDNHI